MGSKLPDDLKWCEAATAFLTDKTSAKSVCIAV